MDSTGLLVVRSEIWRVRDGLAGKGELVIWNYGCKDRFLVSEDGSWMDGLV